MLLRLVFEVQAGQDIGVFLVALRPVFPNREAHGVALVGVLRTHAAEYFQVLRFSP